jgi:hypothetical protein
MQLRNAWLGTPLVGWGVLITDALEPHDFYGTKGPLRCAYLCRCIADSNPKATSPQARDGAMAERLWAVSEELVKGYL